MKCRLETLALWLLTLVSGVAAAMPLAAQGDDEIVAEFRRYYKKYRDTPTRIEAVLALKGSELVEVVDVLVPLLSEAEPEVGLACIRVLAGFQTRPPIDHLLAVLGQAKDEAEKTGILRALKQGEYAGTRDAVLPLLSDSSWDVRRRALQTLADFPDPEVVEAVAVLCEEKEVAVRCAALECLAALGSERVLEPARRDLESPSWQVRATAIAALGRVRHRDSIGPLIERMALEEGRLVEDIARSLTSITGRDYGTRIDGWQRFWETFADRFQIPTEEELVKLAEARAKNREQYVPGAGTISYLGLETPSQSIVFVIDVSGSMEQEVIDRARFEDGEYPSWKRIDVIKTELIKTVRSLEPSTEFNIIAFATDVDPWKKKLVRANALNKSSAESWVGRLEAIGGNSKEDLARAGLVGSANLEGGKTNTYAALMAALDVDPDRPERGYETDIDTIVFLSDGRPSHGRFVEPDDVLREIRTVNELRKVTIHTITLGEFEKDFMERLALENGGTFVDLGH